LRNELNQLSPSRDKATDGSIGDAAHAAEPSDHNPDETGTPERYDSDGINEVHAIDVDKDLRKSGWNMTRVVRTIADRHRRGLDNRLEYIIWDRQIASRGSGWAWVGYDGSNPHTDHAHFSARYGSGSGTGNPENITAPWGLLDEEDDDFMGLFKDLDEYKAYQVSLIQNQVPDAMKKALADDGVVRPNMLAVVGDGVREEKWDAIHAIRRDAVYQAASPQRQGEMRNAMDLSKIVLREALVRILNAKEGDVDAANDLLAQTALKEMVKEAVQELTAEGKLKA
jgi:hypothetical protein